MFEATLLSLCDGQSYKNVRVLDPSDYKQFNVTPVFEEWTLAFIDNNKRILAHAFNVKVIHLHTIRPRLSGCIPFERVVFAGNIVYGPGEIIPPELYHANGIPDIFNSNFGLLGQLTLATQEGVLIASDYNVTTLTLADSPVRHDGVAQAHSTGVEHARALSVAKVTRILR